MKFFSDTALENDIRETSVRDALRSVRRYVQGLEKLYGRSFERGYIKAYGIFALGKSRGDRPYDFTVNKDSLKCYVRKPGREAIGLVKEKRLLSFFPASEVRNGELRVDIKSPEEAEALLRHLFER